MLRSKISSMGLIILFFTCAWHAGYRINTTPSFPIGLWKIVRPFDITTDKLKIISFCPTPTPLFTVAKKRGYIGNGLLSCPSGFQPLIKKVVAVAGDNVIITPEGVSVNGLLWPHSKPLAVDNKQRDLPQAQSELVMPGFVWVLSDYSSTSFDSRYFGPIAINTVIGVIEPLLVF